MTWIKKLLIKTLRAFAEYGLKGFETPQVIREYMIINLFAVVVTAIASTMFALNYAAQQYYNASIIAFMIIMGLLLFMVHLGIKNRWFTRSAFSLFIMSISFGILWLNLEGEDVYQWLYLMPILLLYVCGVVVGGVSSAILFALIATFVFAGYGSQDLASLPKIRFFLSFSAITLLSAITEFAREQVEREWRKVTHTLDVQAHTDMLTGLFNRRDIFAHIHDVLERATINETDVSVIMCDIDHFKVVNDTYGHDAGDSVLVFFSRLLKGMIRGNDYLCRWGGEEFLLILPETPEHAAKMLSERLRVKIKANEFHVGKNIHHVTASFGVAVWDKKSDVDTLIQLADEKMYVAKANGRDQVC